MSFDFPEEKLSFAAACFSTNYQNSSTISIMKQYFMSTECLDIEYFKNIQVDFTHKLLGENGSKIECRNTYIEIYPLIKTNKMNDKIDCYIIFFDLENSESLIELNKILNFISLNGDVNTKVYVINIYTNEKNIKSNLTEENINVYFGKYSIMNYDISNANLDSSDELVKVIDSITEDTLQDKNLFRGNKVLDSDRSKSLCLII